MLAAFAAGAAAVISVVLPLIASTGPPGQALSDAWAGKGA